MSLPYPPPRFADGPWAIAKEVTLPEFSSPIPGVAAEYMLSSKWQIFRNNFSPLAITSANTHPDYASYYITDEGPRQQITGGAVMWERTYCAVPATHNEWETFGYSFIGILQVLGTSGNQTRGTRLWKVSSRVQHDYFMLGVNQTDPITGRNYTPSVPGDIDKILAMQYCYQATFSGDLLGGVTLTTDQINPSASSLPTVPSTETYLAMISDAISNKWGAGASKITLFATTNASHEAGTIDTSNSTFAGQIPADDSRLSRWRGNIWLRQTRYVLAQ